MVSFYDPWFIFVLLRAVGGTGFAVCAVLLIVIKKKTAPYIGAMASLAVFLLGDFLIAEISGYFTVDPVYIVIGLSAAAVSLYWWAQRGNRGL